MKILCALRGGSNSEKTIMHAISLAKEEGARLVFLYVVSLELFSSSSGIRAEGIANELSRMGEFILLMAQAKAAHEGIAADMIVRHGDIVDEILAQRAEMRIKKIIMGKTLGKKESYFDADSQEIFVKAFEDDYGVKVVLV